MARASYSGEQIDWLAREYRAHQIPELTRRYNARWGTVLTDGQIRSAICNHHLRSGRATRRTYQISYTTAEIEWLARWYPRVPRRRLAELFEARFGRRVAPGALAQRSRAYDIRAGLAGYQSGGRSPETRFRPGDHPPTTVPIGSYTRHPDGYWLLKVSDRDPARAGASNSHLRDWRPVHRLTYEGYHGPIPPGHVVILVDGDQDACLDPDNVACLSRAELARLNQAGFSDLPPDRALRRAAIAAAKLKQTAHRRGRDAGIGLQERNRLLGAGANFPPRDQAAAERLRESYMQPGHDPRRSGG